MKNFLIPVMMLSVLTFLSFSCNEKVEVNPSDHEKLIQLSLNAKMFEDIYKREASGAYRQAVLITNELISENITVTHYDKKVKLVTTKEEAALLDTSFTFIEFKELAKTNSGVQLKFKSNEATVDVTLKKNKNDWTYKSSCLTKKGTVLCDKSF